jgi:hypothetical protein
VPRLPVFNGIDVDLTGKTTGAERSPGPLADPNERRVRSVDPRSAARELATGAGR